MCTAMLRYQGEGGISRAMFLVRQGASKPPAMFLPRMPPRTVSGNPTACGCVCGCVGVDVGVDKSGGGGRTFWVEGVWIAINRDRIRTTPAPRYMSQHACTCNTPPTTTKNGSVPCHNNPFHPHPTFPTSLSQDKRTNNPDEQDEHDGGEGESLCGVVVPGDRVHQAPYEEER